MHCPNCGSVTKTDQKFCRACGLSLPEFSQLLADKMPAQPEELQVQKRRLERLALRLWTGAGTIFYIALYWVIISEIIIVKGHVLGGILFLLVITAISVGGLLILYSSALKKRSAYRLAGQSREKGETSPNLSANHPADLAPSATEHTTELLEKKSRKKNRKAALREK